MQWWQDKIIIIAAWSYIFLSRLSSSFQVGTFCPVAQNRSVSMPTALYDFLKRAILVSFAVLALAMPEFRFKVRSMSKLRTERKSRKSASKLRERLANEDKRRPHSVYSQWLACPKTSSYVDSRFFLAFGNKLWVPVETHNRGNRRFSLSTMFSYTIELISTLHINHASTMDRLKLHIQSVLPVDILNMYYTDAKADSFHY